MGKVLKKKIKIASESNRKHSQVSTSQRLESLQLKLNYLLEKCKAKGSVSTKMYTYFMLQAVCTWSHMWMNPIGWSGVSVIYCYILKNTTKPKIFGTYFRLEGRKGPRVAKLLIGSFKDSEESIETWEKVTHYKVAGYLAILMPVGNSKIYLMNLWTWLWRFPGRMWKVTNASFNCVW